MPIIINTPMFRLILTLLIVGVLSRNYPLIKCCDQRWGQATMGTSSQTICQKGQSLCCLSMILQSRGKNYNPVSLNNWLKDHKGYVNGYHIVWSALKQLGLDYVGPSDKSSILPALESGKDVMPASRQDHYFVVTGHQGNTLYVNDPSYTTTSYDLSTLVLNQTIIFEAPKTSSLIIE